METRGEGAPERFIKRRKRAKLTDNLKKTCAICGAAAKGLHFGAMACNSCKAFFRRNVQSDSYKSFKGSGKKSCPVIKDNRKMCQYCRFQKGLSVGMEVKWVMTDEERLIMWKSKLSRQKQHESEVIDSTNSSSDNCDLATSKPDNSCGTSFEVSSQATALLPEDERAINHLVVLQELVFSSISYSENCLGDTPSALSNLFFGICQKLHSFFFRLEDFHEISKKDQSEALRSGISIGLYMHGAYNYDKEKRAWPAPNIKKALSGPNLSLNTVKIMAKYPETYSALMNFFDEYEKDFKDEAVLAICCVIALFYNHVKSCFDSSTFIHNVNNRFVNLLMNYLRHKRGIVDGKKLFQKIMNGMFIVNKITNYHKVIDIKHSVDLDQLINKKKKLSLVDQIASLSRILSQSFTLNIPKYSSSLTPEEKVDLKLIRMNQGLTFRRPQILPNPKIDLDFHHPLTNKLLGLHRTDTLLSYKYKNILHLKVNHRRIKFLSESSSCSSTSEENELKKDFNELKIKAKENLKFKEKKKFKNKNRKIIVQDNKSPPDICQLNEGVTLFESDPIKFSHSVSNIAPFASQNKSFALNIL